MILWSTKKTTEKVPAIPSMGLRSWRWVLDIGRSGLLVEEQFRTESDQRWGFGNRYVMLSLDSNFKFGEVHVYHNGPNCCINLGFLRLSYSLDHCEICDSPYIDELE